MTTGRVSTCALWRRVASLGTVLLPMLAATAQADLPAPKSVSVEVYEGKTRDTNVGVGFDLIDKEGIELNLLLSTQKGRIVHSELISSAQGTQWFKVKKNENGEEDPEKGTEDPKHWRCVVIPPEQKPPAADWRGKGIGPSYRFYCIIKCTIAHDGEEGDGVDEKWISVSDVNARADAANQSAKCPREPSGTEEEALAQHAGFLSSPTLPGVVIGVNDDHDEFLEGGQLLPTGDWGRDKDNDTADLSKEGKNYEQRSVGLIQVRVNVGAKRVPGDLEFAVPSSLRLFEEEGKKFEGRRDITAEGDHPYVFYVEATQPSHHTEELRFTYKEGPVVGDAVDRIGFLAVKMDIDVDSNNDGVINEDDDEIEAKPDEPGMFVPITDAPASGKPGILRSFASPNVASLLDSDETRPVVKLMKLSGDGDVRVWKVRQGQDPVLMLDTSAPGDWTTQDGDGNSLFDLLGQGTDQELVITGIVPGTVVLGLQLVVNKARVHMDVCKVNVKGLTLVEAGDYIVPKSNRNLVSYSWGHGDAPDSIEMQVYDKHNTCVRTISALPVQYPEGKYAVEHTWDGCNDQGAALVEAGSPYTIKLLATWGDQLAPMAIRDRHVKEWKFALTISDKEGFEGSGRSGIDLDTIAGENFTPKLRVAGGDEVAVTKWTVVPIRDDGTPDEDGKNAKVTFKVGDGAADWLIVYTTPSFPPDHDYCIFYDVTTQVTAEGAKDRAANEWDMDKDTPGVQRSDNRSIVISPNGVITEIEVSP